MPWIIGVDEGIAPLVQELWKAGIETSMSCQETDTGMAWIEFPTVGEALKFLNLAVHFEDGDDSLYKRANMLFYSEGLLPDWEYQIDVVAFDPAELALQHGDIDLFDASVGINFPHEDMDSILERLKAINACSAEAAPVE